LACNFLRQANVAMKSAFFISKKMISTKFKKTKNLFKMKFSISKIFMAGFIILAAQSSWAQTATSVAPFTKVIISPNIQVTFVEGNKESVTVEKSTVSADKIHIEVNDNT